MEKSEPTTGEIVEALRHCVSKGDCQECRYDMGLDSDCLNVMSADAADRLESLTREIAELTDKVAKREELNKAEYLLYKADTVRLTARAEQAERERDAAINKLRGDCGCCKNKRTWYDKEPCASCVKSKNCKSWEFEGKNESIKSV